MLTAFIFSTTPLVQQSSLPEEAFKAVEVASDGAYLASNISKGEGGLFD